MFERPTKVPSRSSLLRAGLVAGIAAVLLGATSLFATSQRGAEAASIPGPVVQAPAAAHPDVLVCDNGFFPTFGFAPGFGSGFLPGSPFFTGSTILPSPLGQLFFGNNFFFNNGFQFNFDNTCTTDCSQGVPAVLLPNVCNAPVGGITAVSTINTVNCGSNSNLTFTIRNSLGVSVPDGTNVGATANIGRVTPTATTTSGQVTFSVIMPPKTSGIDTVTITSGAVSTQYSLVVTC